MLEGQSQCGREFERGSHQLASMLGLTAEWWAGQHVNDRSQGPCYAPEYAAHRDWYTCREVREALLAAAANQPQRSFLSTEERFHRAGLGAVKAAACEVKPFFRSGETIFPKR
jgi:hypothetical protein